VCALIRVEHVLLRHQEAGVSLWPHICSSRVLEVFPDQEVDRPRNLSAYVKAKISVELTSTESRSPRGGCRMNSVKGKDVLVFK
jgi:hypothetical protein